MRNALALVAMLLPVSAVASEPVCDAAEVAATLGALETTSIEDRPVVVLGVLAESCQGLPANLRQIMKASAHSNPADWPQILGMAANPDESRDEFDAACRGWQKQVFAAKFSSAPPKPATVFRACRFERAGVVSSKEFAAVDVRTATFALVLHHALVARELDASSARKLVRMILVPGDVPVKPRPPPPEPPRKFKSLGDLPPRDAGR